jgi:HEAT repeat protein
MTAWMAVALAGCASWSPFAKKPDSARDAYGPTADQRIKQLAADAKAAKGGDATARTAFARSLVDAMLTEHDARVRCRILEAAADLDEPAALAICRGGLEDPDDRVRMAACSAWAKRGGPEAVELLATRFQADPELDVRLRALRALGECREPAAIAVLARALEDSDPAVQYRAVGALKRVSGKNLGNDVNRWREWAADPQGSTAEWSIAEAFRSLF